MTAGSRDRDDLTQLRRLMAGRVPSRPQVPDANGVLVGRVPDGAVVAPGPIVVMCEPLNGLDAVEKSGGAVTPSFVVGADALVPIVVLGGTVTAGTVLVARPVAGRWVAEQGGGAAGPLCGAASMLAESLVAVVTHGTHAGQWIGDGIARRCVPKIITESFVMRRVELPPFVPAALPGWPGSIHRPIAWPPPPEAGAFVPLILSEHDAYGLPIGPPIHFYGYGSTNGVYFVSEPIRLDRDGLPSECYPPADCPGFWLPNHLTLVACCLPLVGLGLVAIETAAEPVFVDGLPQLDLTQLNNFGYGRPNSVYGDGPRIGRLAPCPPDGRGIGTGAIPLDWSGLLGQGYQDAMSYPLELNGGFAAGLNGSWRGHHGCDPRCAATAWIGRILIGEDTAPPPPDPMAVVITVCGCRCDDHCCPVSGVTVRYRDGLNDVSAVTDIDGRVEFAGLGFVGAGTGTATVDLTPPSGLSARFTAATRYVARGGGSHVVSLGIAPGHVCIGAFLPIPDRLVFIGSALYPYSGPLYFDVTSCGFEVEPGVRRVVMEASGMYDVGTYLHRLTIEAGACAATGGSWKIEMFGAGGEIGRKTGGTWSLESPYFAGTMDSVGTGCEACVQTFEITPG